MDSARSAAKLCPILMFLLALDASPLTTTTSLEKSEASLASSATGDASDNGTVLMSTLFGEFSPTWKVPQPGDFGPRL